MQCRAQVLKYWRGQHPGGLSDAVVNGFKFPLNDSYKVLITDTKVDLGSVVGGNIGAQAQMIGVVMVDGHMMYVRISTNRIGMKSHKGKSLRERLADWYREQVRIKNEVWITKEEALAIAERYVAENGLHKLGNLGADKGGRGFIVHDGGRPGLWILISPSGEILDK